MAVKNYQATCSEKEKVAENAYRVRFNIDNGETIDSQAGQFFTLLVAPNIRRSYSISSLPSENTCVETWVDTVAGGPGSQFFEKVQIGDKTEFLAPLGKFIYKEDSRPAYFFATNTGITPFIAMIRLALEQLHSKRTLRLYLGFRFTTDIFAESIFKQLAEQYPNFTYVISLSKPDETWQGYKGRITEHLDREVGDANIDAYICGSQSMILDVKNRLLAKGVSTDHIFYEQFY